MTNSLRELLSGCIDYAGTYPPASLELSQAVANFREYRTRPEAWLLGKMVVPAAGLSDLGALEWSELDGSLSVVLGAQETVAAFQTSLEELMSRAGQSGVRGAVAALEACWPTELLEAADTTQLWKFVSATTAQLSSASDRSRTLFLEFSPDRKRTSDGDRYEALRHCITALARYDEAPSSRHCTAGLKFRTGGADTAAFPDPRELASILCACRDGGVFWKATAGLHHLLRHRDPATGKLMHGFLNVMTAAVLCEVLGLSAAETQPILEETELSAFRLTDAELAWRDQSVPVDGIRFARERALRSFGSCSFDEPREDLAALGLL